jgi:hypothetical protein
LQPPKNFPHPGKRFSRYKRLPALVRAGFIGLRERGSPVVAHAVRYGAISLLLALTGCRSLPGPCSGPGEHRPAAEAGKGDCGSPCPPLSIPTVPPLTGPPPGEPIAAPKQPCAGERPKLPLAAAPPESPREVVHKIQVEMVHPPLSAPLMAAPPVQYVATPLMAAGPQLVPVQAPALFAAAPAAPALTLGLRLDWLRLPLPFLRPVACRPSCRRPRRWWCNSNRR